MNYTASKNYQEFIESHFEKHLENLITIAQIPAPSHNEDKRCEFLKSYVNNLGKDCYIDKAKNVVVPFNCENSDSITVFCAHTDVVFNDTTPLPLEINGDIITCPGICDDTANVAGLLTLMEYIIKNDIKPKNGLLLVFNSCEEGLGNLKGSLELVTTFKDKLDHFVSFDGGFGHVCNAAVGSHRYKVDVTATGGHSYSDFGNDNAIAILSEIITQLYTIQVPTTGKTTYNVGTIEGGSTVNTIAATASMLYEYRSDTLESLEFMKNKFNKTIDLYRSKGYDIKVDLVGNRPCANNVCIDKQNILTQKAIEIGEMVTGMEYYSQASSTDCNSALANGVNAICFGLCKGKGAHTRGEILEISSLKPGLEIIGLFMKDYFENF